MVILQTPAAAFPWSPLFCFSFVFHPYLDKYFFMTQFNTYTLFPPLDNFPAQFAGLLRLL